ncbi:peptide chain release factor N(5)-glutamine methyltransferase [Planomicrobium sp. YIM 101495]|uniref:peptide chain release factor N(5)-glutamine methyltransferase n=1 Tax=Planomicrobium sp. YIM 101495 TaxID=2665160 RepID=UPI0012B786DD|nr:peptide chain release factor N(5)-glutamine methyltransferase [Planomicrobium sp. YIM 101495]MTD30852.1 peptide chain release factor N(5)-glutamine methyltransferase [Planomicrobium sp. YIM 101495]
MADSKKIFEALRGASSFLAENGREEATARMLLQAQLGLSHASLLASMRAPLSPEQLQQFEENVEQLAKGVPVQHLTGQEEFYGRTFTINPDVLIPRPETEELVEQALLMGKALLKKDPAIVDIGTGSGAIAVSMKCEWPDAQVTATDLSERALMTAETNAKRLGAAIKFRQGDLLTPIKDEKWDMVLSNPPYIGLHESPELADTVRDHEPHMALFAEREGLALYERLAEGLPEVMNRPGLIGLEIGHLQGEAVENLLKNAFPDDRVFIRQDINKRNRMVFCILQ